MVWEKAHNQCTFKTISQQYSACRKLCYSQKHDDFISFLFYKEHQMDTKHFP